LLPHFKAAGVNFRAITTASGVSAYDVGKRFGFARAVSGAEEVINDDEVNLVVIGTRHDLHAQLAGRALERNLCVFVEKPLALTEEELDHVLQAAVHSTGQLMVGFNRRFSPLARAAKEFFGSRRAPLSIVYRVNAGRAPRNHWSQNEKQGGGRIIGEVCHFVDLMQFWTGARPVRVYAEAIATRNYEIVNDDSVMITLGFADGSNGSIAYLSEGDPGFPKERVEIYAEKSTFVLDDFRTADGYRDGRQQKWRLRKQDKGQAAEVQAICAVVLREQPAPITLGELEATTRATFRIADSLRTGQPVHLQ
jgi:predicted dehydrogenase